MDTNDVWRRNSDVWRRNPKVRKSFRKLETLSVTELLKLQERIKDELRHINKLRSDISKHIGGNDNGSQD